MISQEKALEYLNKNDGTCPKCGSGDIFAEEFEFNAGSVTQEISCEKCGLIYYDIYNLAGVGIIDPEEIREYYTNGRVEHG